MAVLVIGSDPSLVEYAVSLLPKRRTVYSDQCHLYVCDNENRVNVVCEANRDGVELAIHTDKYRLGVVLVSECVPNVPPDTFTHIVVQQEYYTPSIHGQLMLDGGYKPTDGPFVVSDHAAEINKIYDDEVREEIRYFEIYHRYYSDSIRSRL